MSDTIFALSSGAPPAAIAVIRISGSAAGDALSRLCGRLPAPRRASLRPLRDEHGDPLDSALVLWFPAPASATGEDCAELHCHGGRAVVAAIAGALARMPGLRPAQAGEFTRRAFANGRIDLTQAEALGDLLAAETELQRRIAQGQIGGALSARVKLWRERLLRAAAAVEAALDFADEDDVGGLATGVLGEVAALRDEIATALAAPRTERLRDGVRIVIAGPPNAGKSSLFNAMVGEGAAIVTPIAGTTRDVLERAVAVAGVPLVLVDTAGLRVDGAETVEALGIAKARQQIDDADLVLWLGAEHAGPAGALEIQPRADDPTAPVKTAPAHVVSAVTGAGVGELLADLAHRAGSILPKPGATAVNARQAALLGEVVAALPQGDTDLLVMAEELRLARAALDRLLGNAGVEDMLDALFSRFCIGK